MVIECRHFQSTQQIINLKQDTIEIEIKCQSRFIIENIKKEEEIKNEKEMKRTCDRVGKKMREKAKSNQLKTI